MAKNLSWLKKLFATYRYIDYAFNLNINTNLEFSTYGYIDYAFNFNINTNLE